MDRGPLGRGQLETWEAGTRGLATEMLKSLEMNTGCAVWTQAEHDGKESLRKVDDPFGAHSCPEEEEEVDDSSKEE